MKIKASLFAAAVTLALPQAAPAQSLIPTEGAYTLGRIPDQYICVFKAQRFAALDARASAQALVGRAKGELRQVYSHAVKGFAARMTASAAARTQLDASIAFCEQDQEIRILAKVESIEAAGRITAQAQSVPWGITRVGGGVTYTGARRAWVIDSGIDLDHPDLNVDVARSRSFVSGESSADDGNGHGSHVAGTIAAKANSTGVIGVAAGAPVVAVKVLGRNGSGSTSGVIAGVDYVTANAVVGDVANMSLGGGISTALDQAVSRLGAAGIKVALAAGNENQNANNSSPARVNGTNIYTVSAFAQGDVRSSFSNYGNPPVDVAEPGSSIYSTYSRGRYATLSGTSMAAPHMAGLLLLGPVYIGGYVTGDPDGTADPIGVR